jgi:hypothetical protein
VCIQCARFLSHVAGSTAPEVDGYNCCKAVADDRTRPVLLPSVVGLPSGARGAGLLPPKRVFPFAREAGLTRIRWPHTVEGFRCLRIRTFSSFTKTPRNVGTFPLSQTPGMKFHVHPAALRGVLGQGRYRLLLCPSVRPADAGLPEVSCPRRGACGDF